MTPQDDDLRERFQELRRQDERGIPRFSRPAIGVPTPGDRGRWRSAVPRLAGVFGIIGVAVVAIYLSRQPDEYATPHRPEESPAPAAVSITQWRAPTDFLLETPGGQLLNTVPRFDGGLQPPPRRRFQNQKSTS